MNLFPTLLNKLSNELDCFIIRSAQWIGIDPPIALVRVHYWFSWGEMRPVWRELYRLVLRG